VTEVGSRPDRAGLERKDREPVPPFS